MDELTYRLSVLVSILGLVAIGVLAYLALYLSGRFRFLWQKRGDQDLWEMMWHSFFKAPSRLSESLPRYVAESYNEFLQRRNEFWTSFGQVVIAIIIIVVLTILLLTKTISAEAGLPILSGISGFAIAKGVAAGKSISFGPERPQG